MNFLENEISIIVENNKGDFAFSYSMQKGASWVLAKQAVCEIYEEIVRRELVAHQTQQAAQQSPQEVPQEVVAEVMGTNEEQV